MKLLNVKDIATNQKEIEFSIDRAAFDAEVNNVFKKNASKFNVPGFRRGKAPKAFIEKMYGEGVFYEDALNNLLPKEYEAVLAETKLDTVSRPEIDVKSLDENGVVITAKVYVRPQLTITEYKGLKATRKAVSIEDEAVDAEIEKVRERNARVLEISDRPAKNGDEVVFDFDGYVDGKPFDGGKAENRLTSLIDLPPTFLSLAGIPIPPSYMGKDLCQMQQTTQPLHDCVFMQISESQCGRAIRTDRFKYAVRTLAPTGYLKYNAGVYFEDYLYDLEKDPIERCNLIRDPRYSHVRQEMKYLLLREMKNEIYFWPQKTLSGFSQPLF